MKTISPHSRRQICKSPVLKTLCTSTFWAQCFSWRGPPLPWGVLSVLSSINLFLLQVRPQIHFYVLTKNQGPRGRVVFDSPYLVTLQIYKELSRIFQSLVARKETFPVVPTFLKRKTNQLPPHSSIRASQDPPPNQARIWRDLSVISLPSLRKGGTRGFSSLWFVN